MPKNEVTPELVNSFVGTPEKEFREYMNSMVAIRRAGQVTHPGPPVLGDDGAYHPSIEVYDKNTGVGNTIVMPGTVAPKAAGKEDPVAMDEQAQKDAENSFKNAKVAWLGMQPYANYKGKKLSADAYVAAVKADLLRERRKLGGAGGTPRSAAAAPATPEAPVMSKSGRMMVRDPKSPSGWSYAPKKGLETRVVPAEGEASTGVMPSGGL
jgi:hypothetical protein